MKRGESLKRISLLGLNIMSLFIYTGFYAYVWFDYYYPIINNYNQGIRLYINGHIIIILLYITILGIFSRSYGSLKIGYLQPGDVFFSQAFTLLAANIITYFQMSLMHNWIVPVGHLALVYGAQLVVAAVWALLCDALYRKMFPPRAVLLIHGERRAADICAKLSERKDRFTVTAEIDVTQGFETVIRTAEGH